MGVDNSGAFCAGYDVDNLDLSPLPSRPFVGDDKLSFGEVWSRSSPSGYTEDDGIGNILWFLRINPVWYTGVFERCGNCSSMVIVDEFDNRFSRVV